MKFAESDMKKIIILFFGVSVLSCFAQPILTKLSVFPTEH